MTLREGNLEAPTRHPIEWQSPDYLDVARTDAELERVFDICHGCRRCVSLCQSFPTLFDLIDATADGEVHGVDKKDYAKVVDQCYLCDLCYMTKCPYVPPHPWNVDFPHLMLRAKAIKYKAGGVGTGEKLLASTDVHGQLAGIPIVVQAVNAANRSKPVRKVLDRTLGVAPDAWLPSLATKRFRSGRSEGGQRDDRDRRRAQPRQGRDLLDVLRELQRARHRPRSRAPARAQRRALRPG